MRTCRPRFFRLYGFRATSAAAESEPALPNLLIFHRIIKRFGEIIKMYHLNCSKLLSRLEFIRLSTFLWRLNCASLKTSFEIIGAWWSVQSFIWYCQYIFTHFTQKFWATMQWNKYPRSVAKWIFIPLRRPQICPSYPSNIYVASLPEAFRLSTRISACYSNSSCNSARSLFSAVLSCNPSFFCRGCKTARSSFM